MTSPARWSTMLALTVVGALLLAACASDAGTSDISIDDVRTPVPAGPNGAVYMTLRNAGDADDRLIGASADVAESVELHETRTEGGAMQMQQVEGGIEIPAGGEAVLEPGGLHVMLLGVDRELAEGDMIDVTLTFEQAGDRQVTAEIVPLGEQPGMEMGSEMEMGAEG